ncbi:MAG TPA: hypothetical protein DCM14_05295 [Clostridiales bacterium UBA8153]|nr:hypothetical protein [Clostridiales bacterium UBA8153]
MCMVTIALLAVGIRYFATGGLLWMLDAICPQAPAPPASETMPPSRLRAALHELLLDRETRVLWESLGSEAERGRTVARLPPTG